MRGEEELHPNPKKGLAATVRSTGTSSFCFALHSAIRMYHQTATSALLFPVRSRDEISDAFSYSYFEDWNFIHSIETDNVTDSPILEHLRYS
jgi:hypothetical protein